MNSTTKISSIEAIALALIVSINRIILYLPQNALLSSGSAAALNILYVGIITLILTFIIYKLYRKFVGSDIIDISEFLGGKIFKNIISFIILVYIIFMSAILIREFCEVIHILYYKNASIVYLIISFIIVGVITNFISSRSVIKTNLLFTIIMIVSLLLCFAFAVPNITYQRIFPILGNGIDEIFRKGLLNIFSFNGLMSLYLIPSMTKSPTEKNLKRIYMSSAIITVIILFLATICLLLSFSFVTQFENISPLYLLISNNHFGEYFQHPESLFILVWVLSFMSYLNIAIMFVLKILKKVTSVKNSKPFIIPVCLLIFILALAPSNLFDARQINMFTSKYISGPFIFVLFPLLLIFANIKKKRRLQ